MALSKEAFEKFASWKILKTSLRVTVIEKGKTSSVLTGVIDAIDPVASQVGLALGTKIYADPFDIEDSVFSIEHKRVTVTRGCYEL